MLQVVLGTTRVVYYFSKAILFDKNLLFISDEDKRINYYGDEYVFFQKVKKLDVSSFYIVTRNGKAYFLGRYFLYPKRIYLVNDVDSFKRGQYLILYGSNIDLKKYLNNHYKVIMVEKTKLNAIRAVVLQKK